MTHCTGFRAAVVARADCFHSLGIDAEPNEHRQDGILELIALPGERRQVRALLAADGAARPRVAWGRFLFSAKESVCKAWYPLMGRFLDFSEAVISLSPDGTFRAGVPPGAGGRRPPDRRPLDRTKRIGGRRSCRGTQAKTLPIRSIWGTPCCVAPLSSGQG
ncbi:4'-phosphopantetheinyl transferase superfamily protein [Streptomyces sp. NPDC051162]|uniref:4'-phosphopantetheinyl transferase family protein n=1 Tax=Streptomyces sp. NPDC051162 TaxID=3154747 RepID=UPI00343F79BA